MTTLRRIKRELETLSTTKMEQYSVVPGTDDLYYWKATIIGPKDTPYEDTIFNIDIFLPTNYPYKPPNIIFKTRIYHPNINSQGYICLDILKDNWSPSLTISKVLLSILSLLSNPNPDDPLMPDLASLYKKDKNLYNKMIKEWTSKYSINN